ncbi:MAG: translation initiation factor IF-3 [Candidatus Gracilibacteria bacterium]|nr:translation initiation factor IF-3 [Candidatus Gracilibacteria bacterium]
MKGKRINDEIKSNRVHLITQEGENLGLVDTDRAISMAEESTMDLVEIGEKEGFPIAKIMDYGKFLFKQQKNVSKSRANSKQNVLKTMRITYNISDHDLGVKRAQILKFAQEGNSVKVIMMLRGRENHYENMAVEKLRNFAESILENFASDLRISKTGTTYSVILNPKK